MSDNVEAGQARYEMSKQGAHTDDRMCKCCQRLDSMECHVHLGYGMSWAYPPSKAEGTDQYRNSGLMCYFCYRVYRAQFEHKERLGTIGNAICVWYFWRNMNTRCHSGPSSARLWNSGAFSECQTSHRRPSWPSQEETKTIKLLTTKLGCDSEFSKEFHYFRDAVVKLCKSAGQTVGLPVRWSEVRVTLLTIQRDEVEEVEAPDTIKLLEDYVKRWGDPKANGHQECMHRGQKAVIIPAEKEWKIYRKRIQESGFLTPPSDDADSSLPDP